MKVKNLESVLDCKLPSVWNCAWGWGYKPLYNGDGVLNLPHEHGSYDARDAEASVLIDRKARRNRNRATMTPNEGKSSIGAVTNNKGGKMGKKDGEVSPYEQGIVLLVVLIAITLIMVWLAQ